jgi:ABC-type multidrug transport system fused ATPase/permease subunit
MVGSVILLAIVSIKLTLTLLAILPFLVAFAVFFGKFIRKLSRQAQDKLAESNTIVEETLQGIANVKAFVNEAYSKHEAEIVANIMTTEKAKTVDALLSTGKSCRRYSRHEIELATDYFSDAKKIGEGGYGVVYRCTLDHTEVAVKVIQQDSRDKINEFFKEVLPFIYIL